MFYKSSGCTTQVAAKELGSALTAHLREKGKHQQVNKFCSEKTHISCLMLLNFYSIPGLLGNGIIGNRLLQIVFPKFRYYCLVTEFFWWVVFAIPFQSFSYSPKHYALRSGFLSCQNCSFEWAGFQKTVVEGRSPTWFPSTGKSFPLLMSLRNFRGARWIRSLSRQNLTRLYILKKMNLYIHI